MPYRGGLCEKQACDDAYYVKNVIVPIFHGVPAEALPFNLRTALPPSHAHSLPAVVDAEGLGHAVVVDVVSEKGTSGLAPGYDALTVEIVGASAGLAQGGAVGVQFHLLEDVVALIAVGAAQVVAGDPALLLQHLGHVGQTHDEASTQAQDEALVALDGRAHDVVGSRRRGRTLDHEPVARRKRDGAEFSQGGAGPIEIGHGRDGRIGEACIVGAETVVGLLAGEQEDYGSECHEQ